MVELQNHLRKTMIAGALAAVPIVGTVVLIVWVEQTTRTPLAAMGINIPGLGIVIAVVTVYLLGLFISSLLGRFFVRLLDRMLQRLPMLKEVYAAWKQINFGHGPGIYSKVALIEDDSGRFRQLGFWSGLPLTQDSEWCCVFVPNAPNPVGGRVLFVRKTQVIETSLSVEDGFKLLLSSGGFIPTEIKSIQDKQSRSA